MFQMMELEGNFDANCLIITEGGVLSQGAKHVKIKLKSLEVVSRCLSKKIPPKMVTKIYPQWSLKL